VLDKIRGKRIDPFSFTLALGVFKLHADELQLKEAQLKKKDEEIQVLQAIISTMSNPPKRKQ
jgi:hypothetical protein